MSSWSCLVLQLVTRRLLVSHANARLAPAGRLIMIQRIGSGRAVAHVAAEMGVSRTTAWRWWRRFRAHGPAGLRELKRPEFVGGS